MAIIGTIHKVEKFISGKSQALHGQRLSKITYKGEKKDKAICVSLPRIDEEMVHGNINALMPSIVRMLESAQDGVIKSMYEGKGYVLENVSDEDVSIAQCIGYMEMEASGGRLTKEGLETWFDSCLGNNLALAFGIKLGFINADADDLEEAIDGMSEGQKVQIERNVKAHKEMIAALASGRTVFEDRQIAGLEKALEYADDARTGDVHGKLVLRLQMMKNKPKIEDVLML